MITEGTKDKSPVYSAWLGKPVVLIVLVRQCPIPMPCSIVGESVADVRVRIQPGWELDIRKELILAVKEDAVARDTRVHWRGKPGPYGRLRTEFAPILCPGAIIEAGLLDLALTKGVKRKIHEIAAQLGIDRRIVAPLTALNAGYGGAPCALCEEFGLTGGHRFMGTSDLPLFIETNALPLTNQEFVQARHDKA